MFVSRASCPTKARVSNIWYITMVNLFILRAGLGLDVLSSEDRIYYRIYIALYNYSVV